jgi:hypothetical protein
MRAKVRVTDQHIFAGREGQISELLGGPWGGDATPIPRAIVDVGIKPGLYFIVVPLEFLEVVA